MAHTRIHTETGNQVCPDCGENFGDRMADFNKHIKLHCFHTSRITGYRCPVSYPSFSTDFYGLYLILIHVFQLSGKVFARLDYLVSHIHNNLLIRFFKCAECPVAFRSQNKIMIHTKVNYKLHSNYTNSTQTIPTPLNPYQLHPDVTNSTQTLSTPPNSSILTFFRKITQKWQCCIDQFINVHFAKQFSTIKNKQTSRNTFTNTSRTALLFVIIV